MKNFEPGADGLVRHPVFLIVLASCVTFLGFKWFATGPILSYIVPQHYANLIVNARTQWQGRKDQYLLRTAVSCTLHDLVIIPLVLWYLPLALANGSTWHDRMFETTDMGYLTAGIAGGYFLFDLIEVATHMKEEGALMLVHAIVATFTLFCSCFGLFQFFVLFLIFKFTDPFMNMNFVLKKFGQTDTALYRVNRTLMVLSWVIVRIGMGCILTYMFVSDAMNCFMRSPPEASGPIVKFVLGLNMINNIFIVGLNSHFLIRMVACKPGPRGRRESQGPAIHSSDTIVESASRKRGGLVQLRKKTLCVPDPATLARKCCERHKWFSRRNVKHGIRSGRKGRRISPEELVPLSKDSSVLIEIPDDL